MKLIFAPDNDTATADTAKFASNICNNFDTVLIGVNATKDLLNEALNKTQPQHTECFFIGHSNRDETLKTVWIIDQSNLSALDMEGLKLLPEKLSSLAYCCYSAFLTSSADKLPIFWWGYTSWIQPPIWDKAFPKVNDALIELVNGFAACSNVNDVEVLIDKVEKNIEEYLSKFADPVPTDIGVYLSKMWQYLAVKVPGESDLIMHKNAAKYSLDWG